MTEEYSADDSNMNFLRQWKFLEIEKIKPITVIGAGSIGSWTVLSLAKMGCQKIKVYDFDKIEEHNGPNQIYKLADMGRPKVEALRDIVKEYAGIEIEIVCEKYDGELTPYIICGIDDIKVRKEIFEQFIYMQFDVDKYWDARMGGEHTSIFCITPTCLAEVEDYRKTLFTKEEASELPCGEQSIVYNNSFIGSFISNQVKCHVMDQEIFKSVDFTWMPYSFSGKTSSGKFIHTMVKGE